MSWSFYRYIPGPEHCSFFRVAFVLVSVLVLRRAYPKRSKDRTLRAPFIFPAGQGPYWFSVGNARARYSHTAALCAYNTVLLQTPLVGAIVSRELTRFARSFSTCAIPRWEISRRHRESFLQTEIPPLKCKINKSILILFHETLSIAVILSIATV